MKYILLLLAGLGCWAQNAQAYTCTTLTSMTTINTPNITIARNLPVGTEIGNTSTSSVAVFKCENSAPTLTYQAFGVKALGTYVTTIDGKRIYRTPIKGIGYAVQGSIYNCGTISFWSGWVGGSATMDGNPNNRGLCEVNGMLPVQPLTGMMNIAYYKIGEVTGSGSVPLGSVAAFILQNNKSAWQTESDVSVSSLAVTTIPCEINQTMISVPMGNVQRKDFKGIGSWPNEENTRSFNIPLSCNPEVKVNVQIDGDIQNANQGVINLIQSNSKAAGVGIQLLFNNAPIKLGTPFSTGTTSINGSYDIPLQARYYQINNKIEPGVANATATFTITYN